jgi:hypothetical protein
METTAALVFDKSRYHNATERPVNREVHICTLFLHVAKREVMLEWSATFGSLLPFLPTRKRRSITSDVYVLLRKIGAYPRNTLVSTSDVYRPLCTAVSDFYCHSGWITIL